MENILQLFFTQLNEHSRKIATVISVILIVLMSLSVANTVLVVMETMDSGTVPLTVPQETRQTSPREQFRVSNLELFGKVQEASVVPQNIDAPETKLNLELQGVFVSDIEENSTAIVAQKNKTGELFHIGDKLPGNATLAAVFVDHVLIRRGSRMEKLLFADSKFRLASSESSATTTASGTPARTLNSPTSQRDRLEQLRNRIRNDAGTSRTRSGGGANQTRAQLEAYRQRIEADPVGTLGELGVSPVAAGDAQGYRIGSDAQAAIRQAGLQPGDVILSVNGRPVGNATSDTALMDQVMSSSRVRVEVQRGTRRFFLTVPVPR